MSDVVERDWDREPADAVILDANLIFVNERACLMGTSVMDRHGVPDGDRVTTAPMIERLSPAHFRVAGGRVYRVASWAPAGHA